jgi:chromosome segregation ATPase
MNKNKKDLFNWTEEDGDKVDPETKDIKKAAAKKKPPANRYNAKKEIEHLNLKIDSYRDSIASYVANTRDAKVEIEKIKNMLHGFNDAIADVNKKKLNNKKHLVEMFKAAMNGRQQYKDLGYKNPKDFLASFVDKLYSE